MHRPIEYSTVIAFCKSPRLVPISGRRVGARFCSPSKRVSTKNQGHAPYITFSLDTNSNFALNGRANVYHNQSEVMISRLNYVTSGTNLLRDLSHKIYGLLDHGFYRCV